MLGDGLMLGRNVLHSTVQYTTKRAVLDDSCPSVPVNVSTSCPASLGSVLMGVLGSWENGHDRISWLVNLFMSLDVIRRFVLVSPSIHTLYQIKCNLCAFILKRLCWLTICLAFSEATCGGLAVFVCFL